MYAGAHPSGLWASELDFQPVAVVVELRNKNHKAYTIPAKRLQLTLDGVVIEVQMLQVSAEERNGGQLVVSELQVQQGGDVEHGPGDAFVTQLVVVEPHEGQVREALEVISEEENNPFLKMLLSKTFCGLSNGYICTSG